MQDISHTPPLLTWQVSEFGQKMIMESIGRKFLQLLPKLTEFLSPDNKHKWKQSQSVSSHASLDFIEEPETMPEYTYLSDSD